LDCGCYGVSSGKVAGIVIEWESGETGDEPVQRNNDGSGENPYV
jgi:hypothetical protein